MAGGDPSTCNTEDGFHTLSCLKQTHLRPLMTEDESKRTSRRRISCRSVKGITETDAEVTEAAPGVPEGFRYFFSCRKQRLGLPHDSIQDNRG